MFVPYNIPHWRRNRRLNTLSCFCLLLGNGMPEISRESMSIWATRAWGVRRRDIRSEYEFSEHDINSISKYVCAPAKRQYDEKTRNRPAVCVCVFVWKEMNEMTYGQRAIGKNRKKNEQETYQIVRRSKLPDQPSAGVSPCCHRHIKSHKHIGATTKNELPTCLVFGPNVYDFPRRKWRGQKSWWDFKQTAIFFYICGSVIRHAVSRCK